MKEIAELVFLLICGFCIAAIVVKALD